MDKREEQRNRIIGLGENSFQKSYYPELNKKIKELEASYDNLNMLFDSVNDGILLHDIEGRIKKINSRAGKLFNIPEEDTEKYTVQEISGKTMDVSGLDDMWSGVLEGNPAIVPWVSKQLGTGKEFPVQVSLNTTVWHGEQVIIAVIRGFSERLQYEKELIAAKEKAEESNKLKTAFLQNLSHEIRTPMNSIMGFSEVLDSPAVSDENKINFIRIIKNSSKKLLEVLNDVLTVSALETGQEDVFVREFDINDMLRDLFQYFKKQAKEKSLDLILTIPEGLGEAQINSDAEKIIRVMENLLANSVKFTDAGEIEFGYRIIKNEPEFFVRDTGPGIDREMHEAVFERFRKEMINKEKLYSGTGLGLAIAKGIIELLGGEISLDSAPGEGAEFRFTVGSEFISEHEVIEDVESQSDDSYILIAEDEDYNFIFLSELLKHLNLKTAHVSNGKEAVEYCKAGNKVTLILMDIKMPEMDGYTAAKEIRKILPDMTIIAQSAYALEHERKQYGDAFDDYITKPFRVETITKVLNRYVKIVG
jgi:PAS domain S-box-containing protein